MLPEVVPGLPVALWFGPFSVQGPGGRWAAPPLRFSEVSWIDVHKVSVVCGCLHVGYVLRLGRGSPKQRSNQYWLRTSMRKGEKDARMQNSSSMKIFEVGFLVSRAALFENCTAAIRSRIDMQDILA